MLDFIQLSCENQFQLVSTLWGLPSDVQEHTFKLQFKIIQKLLLGISDNHRYNLPFFSIVVILDTVKAASQLDETKIHSPKRELGPETKYKSCL